ncbi:Arginyl-tRNA--protein transferase [hydrothermal vent metagenome]|uniref:Arginyl-tRNA--protein transferase n=1 Tax=hydrothermal vent metagenome TaxID=652676 RepID=A0A3B0XI54_9ZZZZ
MNPQNLSLYITTEHECGYYDDRKTANLIPDPQIKMNASLYSLLISKGFRRSGEFVYRPHCNQCADCIPCRINVPTFKASRGQRRCLKTNNGLTTHIVNARFTEEYFVLYQQYMNSRHIDGSMANPSREEFSSFLLNNWNSSVFIESRLGKRLLSVAVVDFLSTGLSAVYTFFDPQESKRSLGTFAVLQQIWLAQLYQLPHIYLGYWINGHPKMDYKRNFSALELFKQDRWLAIV